MIYDHLTELIGGTPLLRLTRFCQKEHLSTTIIAKLECFNPAGSVKDRVALAMLEDAKKKGLLKEGSVIVEPTSGNTGIGLAAVAVSQGYRVILTMPETMSIERRNLLKAYGAQLVLTPGALGMNGAIEKAKELLEGIEGAYMPGQFTNPVNAYAHYTTTAPELWQETGGQIDCFVAGVGTGGTITGVGRYLKEQNPNIRIIAVEPADSPVLSEGRKGAHKIQGIGAGFIPDILDQTIYDEIITVTNDQAIDTMKQLAATEGLLVGISSGAAAYAAVQVAKRTEFAGKTIATLLPDTGSRYLSSN